MSTQPSSPTSLRSPAVSWFIRPLLRTRRALYKPAAARVVLRLLGQLQYGVLDVHLPDGTTRRYGQPADEPAAANAPHARVVLANWNVCAAALKSGDIGFAETYLAGDWHTDDLAALLDIMVRNRTVIETVIYGSWFGKLTNRLRHLRNANSKEGSRRNIRAHYDLGNAFYKLWLDSTMTYSSALFDGSPEQTLADAQRAKYRRLLNELQLDGVDLNVLEIGCGWGGFAELAASEAKARVTGLTLSTEQLAFAQQRMTDAGLADRADLRLQDYRDVHGQFDAIASIEMFEAVGEEYWPGYFECIKRNLKRGGRACVQTITIDNTLFDRYRTSTDFIQQYIFPGGMLPSPAAFVQAAERHGLKVVNQLSFGRDYARTLKLWRNAFVARLDEIRAQRFDERFIRLWDFYLCYCEAAFAHSNTDVIQFTLEHI
ncbi:class I SAM-dependent methyltransferase [Caballeronia sp. DA-9]|uniref:class I SAM-dependent methyltransferase n=1 Tax=Caballeronia sp. DA-9 TaxID=3436237 RepID=UPI003F679B96